MLYIIDKNKGYNGNVLSTISSHNPEAIVHYTNLTLAEYAIERDCKPLVLTWEELEPLIAAYEFETYTSLTPEIIDEERYDYALNCLPPMRWNGDLFAMSEMLTGKLTAWYCKRNGKYATCTDYINATDEHMYARFAAVI